MNLIKYNQIKKSEYLSYIDEWEQNKEIIIPVASDWKGRSFNEMLERWKYDETDEPIKNGFVPSTLYFLVSDIEQIIGAIHFRHSLNEHLMQHGGHVGYGIRPSQRKKGYGSLILGMLLNIIPKDKYDRVMITCDDVNIGSFKAIEKNNGILEQKNMYNGVLSRKYWITL